MVFLFEDAEDSAVVEKECQDGWPLAPGHWSTVVKSRRLTLMNKGPGCLRFPGPLWSCGYLPSLLSVGLESSFRPNQYTNGMMTADTIK